MNKREIGSYFENKASEYFQSLGMEVIEKNFHSRRGEIDLILKDKNEYVFTEVKYRESNDKGYPEEAVNFAKQKKIFNTARYYLLTHGLTESTPCRFDVIAFYADESFKYYKNAFGGF